MNAYSPRVLLGALTPLAPRSVPALLMIFVFLLGIGLGASPATLSAGQSAAFGGLPSIGAFPTQVASVLFTNGFEAGSANCSLAPDADDDGLLDSSCVVVFDPPDPEQIAPAIDTTIATNFWDANGFIPFGPQPIQEGVEPGVIEEWRAAVMRGRVLDAEGEPLPGVLVRVLDHPELGYTYSRTDGHYDLLVNGGGELILDFQKPTLLRAQRRIRTPWNDWALVDDVRLLTLDPTMTPVLLGTAAPAQMASGGVIEDDDGARQARVFFPAGTEAQMTLPSGSQVALPVLHFRATEYTVGEAGLQRMPGELPPTSAYTYAVELSADQAIAAGATRVDFSQPVGLYVDNFLGFPIGSVVPAGWYDFRAGGWVPSENGQVIKILGVLKGLAEIDIDGSGLPATVEALQALGVGADERAQLATSYPVGRELWRTPLSHFTPYDCNWPYVPPDDIEEPDAPDLDGDGSNEDPDGGGPDDDPINDLPNPEDPDSPDNDSEDDKDLDDPTDCEDKASGSIIYCQTQSLGLRVPVAGSNHTLNYRSDRTEAANVAQSVSLRMPDRGLPASLRRATVTFDFLGKRTVVPAEVVAGTDGVRRFRNSRLRIETPAIDVYNRSGWQGSVPYQFRLDYYYVPQYAVGAEFERAFARVSGLPFSNNIVLRSNSDFRVSRTWRPESLPLQRSTLWNAKGQGLGGWMLGAHQVLDPRGMSLLYGDGRQRRVNPSSPGIDTVTLSRGPVIGDLDKAAPTPTPGGSLVLLFEEQIESLLWQSLIERRPGQADRLIARSCVGPNTDTRSGQPEECAEGTQRWTRARAHEVDARGRIILAGETGVHRVALDGRAESLLDPSSQAPCAGTARAIASVAVQIYFACGGVVQVLDGGNVQVFAGGGADTGENVPALRARFGAIGDLLAGPEGDLYLVADRRIRRVSALGRVTTVAGNGSAGDSLDGGEALEQPLRVPNSLAFDAAGVLVYSDTCKGGFAAGQCLREIGRNGRIYTRLGGGNTDWPASGVDRTYAKAPRFNGNLVALAAPDGSLRVIDRGAGRVLTWGNSTADNATADRHLIPESDGSAVTEFDRRGRQLRTLHPLTGATLRTFGYDPEGRLESIEDPFGNRTEITRSATGFQIRSPWGQVSEFRIGAHGYVDQASLPAAQSWSFQAITGGLYESVQTPNQRTKTYDWNIARPGRLASNSDANGETWGADPFSYSDREARTGSRRSPEGRHSRSSREYRPLMGTQTYSSPGDLSNAYASRRPDGMIVSSDSSGRSSVSRTAFDPQFLLTAYTRSMTGQGATMQVNRVATPVGAGGLGSVDRSETVSIDGRISTRNYNSTTRTWTVTSPEGRSGQTALDPYGRVMRRETPGLAPVEYHYDPRGRLEEIRVGTGSTQRVTRMGYDDRGFLEWAEDPLKRRVSYQRDDLGRPSTITLADQRQIGIGWDRSGNLTRVTPPGKPDHNFDYTDTERLGKYRPPVVGAGSWDTSYPRDRDSVMTSAQRPDGTAINVSRIRGSTRVDGVSWAGGQRSIQWGDTYEKFRSITEANGSQLQALWQEEVPEAQIWTGADVTGRVNFRYGSARRLTGLEVVGGSDVTYGYDLDSLLTSAEFDGVRFDLERDPDNGLLEGSSVGDLTDVWTHNSFAEPTSYAATFNANVLFTTNYGRDRLGRIDSRSESAAGSSFSDVYAYETSGRLDTVYRDGGMASDYGFDTNGNRSNHRIGPTSALRGRSWPCLGDLTGTAERSVSGDYDAQDRMTRYGSCTYEYTRNGELTRRSDSATSAVTEYEYDPFGNLRTVELADGREISYHIDSLNRRVGKSVDGVRQAGWLYANQLEPVAELDAAGNVVASFIYADRPHVPSLMRKGGQTYRILSDHLGSVRLVVNLSTGAIEQRMSYDEYGNVVEDTHPGFQPFGYAGGLYDRDTGLVRFGARDYDALTGRWTAKDPSGIAADGFNVYSYGDSMPVDRFDPAGRASCVYNIVAGTLSCVSSATGTTLSIAVASGNNGGGSQCKNNPFCTHLSNQGPIPQGEWEWTNGLSGKPNGRVLEPLPGTEVHGRDLFRTHSCINAFGPSISSPYCSKGCITGSVSDIQQLNALLDSEPASTLTVESGYANVQEMLDAVVAELGM